VAISLAPDGAGRHLRARRRAADDRIFDEEDRLPATTSGMMFSNSSRTARVAWPLSAGG